MKKIILNSIFLLAITGFGKAQVADSITHSPDSFFQNEFLKYEGFPAPIFQAPDMEGTIHYLEYYKHHIVILHFCQIYSEPSVSQMPSLNRIVDEYFDQGVVVFSFAVESAADVRDFLENTEVKYHVIPNSMEFSLEHYGGGLGFPRTFVIDKYGIVQKVTIGGKSGDYMDLYERLKPVIEEHLKY